jgi:hypothetical protein
VARAAKGPAPLLRTYVVSAGIRSTPSYGKRRGPALEGDAGDDVGHDERRGRRDESDI